MATAELNREVFEMRNRLQEAEIPADDLSDDDVRAAVGSNPQRSKIDALLGMANFLESRTIPDGTHQSLFDLSLWPAHAHLPVEEEREIATTLAADCDSCAIEEVGGRPV